MNHADRVQAGPDLEWRLEREVALLDIDHPNGFAVRLHNLGDFYSLQYVALWRRLLARHSALHVWGYTAHWNDPIAAALASLVDWDRFAMRFSNAPSETRSTISVEHPYQVPPDAILCPEQIGRTEVVLNVRACAGNRSGALPLSSTKVDRSAAAAAGPCTGVRVGMVRMGRHHNGRACDNRESQGHKENDVLHGVSPTSGEQLLPLPSGSNNRKISQPGRMHRDVYHRVYVDGTVGVYSRILQLSRLPQWDRNAAALRCALPTVHRVRRFGGRHVRKRQGRVAVRGGAPFSYCGSAARVNAMLSSRLVTGVRAQAPDFRFFGFWK